MPGKGSCSSVVVGAAWGQVRTAFTGALKRASITGFRFQDLRHTFASHFVMREGSLTDLQEILGHADYKMTRRYAHLSPKHLQATMQRMEGLTSTTAAGAVVSEDAVALVRD